MNFEINVEKWSKLIGQGEFLEAKKFYFENLFEQIINRFVENNQNKIEKVDVLFSVLGCTPEPIILTQRALQPKVHIIFNNITNNAESQELLKKYLTSNYQIISFKDETYTTIYNCMKEQLSKYQGKKYALDITGGKKSMVASAAIFGKENNFDILYVDYETYIAELRRPKPGTEILNLVYNSKKDL